MNCSEAATMMDELALDVLPGDERAALLAHIEWCARCRHALDELTEAAALVLSAPATPPPGGFEDGVLGRIARADDPRATPAGLTGPPGAAPERRDARRAHPRRTRRTSPGSRPARTRRFAAAAAAAALLGAGAVAGAVFARARGDGSGREFHTVSLVSASGARVGDVEVYAGPPAWVFMRVGGTVAAGTYQCLLGLGDGRMIPVGRIVTTGAGGGWGEPVAVSAGLVTSARVVAGDGTTVAQARLG